MLLKLSLFLLLFFLTINPAYSVQLSDQLSPEESSPTSIEEESKAVIESLANKLEGKPVLSDNWMIVTANSYASVAGAKILESGGTAADAMIAAQAVLGLVEPESSGLGGGAFLVWYDNNTKKIVTLDGRETAPLSAKSSLFQNEEGEPMKFFDAVVGGLSVGTPAIPALMDTAHKRWGSKEWSILFDDAIKLSENGFSVSAKLAASIDRDAERLSVFKTTKDYFLPDGSGLSHKEIVTNHAYARTLKSIASSGIETFYRGEIASDIIKTIKKANGNQGLLEKIDLESYRIIERDPVCIDYKEYNICGMGPPSSGGVAVGQILGILNNFDLKALGSSSPISWQLIGDASRLAFADRDRYLADSDFVSVPLKGLLDKEYLHSRSNELKVGIKAEPIVPGNPVFDQALHYADDISIEFPSTSHISIVDSYGNVLSMTTTIENVFGSRLMTKGGFLLNNELTDFSFKDQENGTLIANRLEPGKRPRSSMAPTIVLKDGQPKLVIGSPGGSNIIGFVINSLIAFIEWDMDAQEIVSMPHAINRWGVYEIESSSQSKNLQVSLEKIGYKTKLRKYSSGLNAIIIDQQLEGGSDPRREGIALGN